MVYNAGNRKDVRYAEKQARLAEQQRREIVAGIMRAIPGRRWMLEKLEECHVFATSFSRDAFTMAFMEGQRDIGLKLLNDIMASCPDEYILMMREANERRSTSERTSGQNGNRGDQGPVTSSDSSASDIYTDSYGSEADDIASDATGSA